ncbi:hypothetical protein MKX34_26710 [Paenibacillus sp. FSL R5-0636]|uniref:hypothetical protein n=1 Tax=Paenibacillus TaxID=44249 RepID=UPI00096D5FB9|nr:hypothetical protein [Paenibacillus odorifer]OMD00051.1 hypothetical protein BJP49_28565 [Paenibacillus odorifer]OMD29151.1 hypothetical protein BJP48_18840 [Paenibacillus odorifer]
MIRIGTVSTVNTIARTVRVSYPDKDDLVSGELPVIGPITLEMPIPGETVLVGYPDNSTDGYCIGVIQGGAE